MRLDGSAKFTWLALAIVGLLLVAGLLPIDSLSSPASRRQLRLSVELAVGSAVIAVGIALPLAVLLTRVKIMGRDLAWLVVALLLFAPLYVHLAGWDAVGGWLGWYGRSAPQAPLTGIVSAIWVHGVAAVPWAIVLIAAGLAQVPRHEEELALLEAPPLVNFTSVLLPRIAPWIVTAGCFTAVISWHDMTVTNVYLVPTVTEGIYNQIAINRGLGGAGDAVNAVVYLLPAMVVLVGLFSLAAVVSQQLLQADFPRSSRDSVTWPLSSGRWFASFVVWSMLVILAGVPMLVLFQEAAWQKHLDPVSQQPVEEWNFFATLGKTALEIRHDLVWSLLTSASAATTALVIATLVAWWARAGGWRLLAITLIATLLFAVPGPLVGLSVMGVLNQPAVPGFTYLYDRTIAAPALAQAIRALPIALLIVWHGLARFDRNQQEAAALDGCGPWTILRRIVLPQRWQAVLAAWGLAFAVGLGDVSCSQLVIPPGIDTIARRLFGMIHSGVDDQVAAACLLLMAGMVVAAAAISVATRMRKQG